jgi:hypothetical protein
MQMVKGSEQDHSQGVNGVCKERKKAVERKKKALTRAGTLASPYLWETGVTPRCSGQERIYGLFQK